MEGKHKYSYENGIVSLKIIIIGNSGSGKTSIITRFIENKFENKIYTTIVPCYSQKIIDSNGIQFHANLWDIPGQDRSPIVTKMFATDTHGIIFCCAVDNPTSRSDLKDWKESLDSLLDINTIPKILVENKCDLLGDENNYNDNINSLKQISNKLGCLNCFRTSALNGYKIDEALNFLIEELIKRAKEEGIQMNNKTNLTKSTHKEKNNKNSKNSNKCC